MMPFGLRNSSSRGCSAEKLPIDRSTALFELRGSRRLHFKKPFDAAMESPSRTRRKRPRSALLRSTALVELLPRRTSGPLSVVSMGVAEGVQKGATVSDELIMDSAIKHREKAMTYLVQACETCRLKKIKCTQGRPRCAYCSRHGFKCDYPRQHLPKSAFY